MEPQNYDNPIHKLHLYPLYTPCFPLLITSILSFVCKVSLLFVFCLVFYHETLLCWAGKSWTPGLKGSFFSALAKTIYSHSPPWAFPSRKSCGIFTPEFDVLWSNSLFNYPSLNLTSASTSFIAAFLFMSLLLLFLKSTYKHMHDTRLSQSDLFCLAWSPDSSIFLQTMKSHSLWLNETMFSLSTHPLISLYRLTSFLVCFFFFSFQILLHP